MVKTQALRRHAGRIAVLACLAVLPALTAGCDGMPAAAPAASPPPKVGVVTIHPQPVKRTTELPGRTSAVLTAEVRPQVSGVILKRLFTEGSDVTEGQQLYQIDPAPYQAAYDTAEGTLLHDQATLVYARAHAWRWATVTRDTWVSKEDNDKAISAAGEAEGNVKHDQAALEAAGINLKYTKMLSPLSGRISRSSVTPGALVTANQTSSLATVTQL